MSWPTDVDMASIGRTLLVNPSTGLPIGTTTIPVSGTVTVQAGSTVNLGSVATVSVGLIPLAALGPTGNMVGAVSTQAVASNGLRTGLILTNTNGSLSVSFAVATTAVLNTGVTLFPTGTWSMGAFDFTRSAINAIASASGPIISVQEFS